MRLPEAVHELVGRARRRLFMMDVVRRGVVATAVVALMAALAIGIARWVPAPWVEPAALMALVGAWLLVIGWSVLSRPSPSRGAIETDQRMGGYDRVSTALELSGKPALNVAEERQIQETGRWATNRPLTGFKPVWPRGPVLPLAAFGSIVALALALIPAPADAVVEQRQVEEAIVAEEVAALEEQIEQLTPELQDQLAALVEELRETRTLDEAISQLGEAQRDLVEQADPATLSRKTTVAALDREIEDKPIASGSDLAEQLRGLGAGAAALSEEGAQSAAARLDELAVAAEADARLAEQLAMAADALEAGGDPSAHLELAAQAAEAAAGRIAAGEANAAAQATLQAAADALATAQSHAQAQGEGQSQGQGQGQGSGQGEGQGSGQGQGQGPGSGQGQSQGSGQGQGQGPASGNVSGGGASGTPTQGGVGTGTIGRGEGDNDPFEAPGRADVFDPVDFSLGDEVRVDLAGTEPGEAVGRTEGYGLRNLPTAPYVDRHAEYARQALEALNRMTVPTDLQDIVRDYFTKLEP